MNPVIEQVDSIFWFIIAISVLLLIGVTVAMIYFVVRYRAKRNPIASNITGNTTLEVVWTIIPLFLVLIMFFYGWEGFKNMRDVPKDAYTIKVTGKMWMWSFDYPTGKKSDTILYVPVNKHIKVEIQSADVLHSFYLPQFRVKEDAVPGRTNYITFFPTQLGIYDIFCAEYCGMNHSYMLGHVKVLPEAEYLAWVNKVDSVKKDSAQTTPQTTGTTNTNPPKTDSMKVKTDSVKVDAIKKDTLKTDMRKETKKDTTKKNK